MYSVKFTFIDHLSSYIYTTSVQCKRVVLLNLSLILGIILLLLTTHIVGYFFQALLFSGINGQISKFILFKQFEMIILTTIVHLVILYIHRCKTGRFDLVFKPLFSLIIQTKNVYYFCANTIMTNKNKSHINIMSYLINNLIDLHYLSRLSSVN